jgi:hypothetical protein
MMRFVRHSVLLVLICTAAGAQPHSIFDPDDFVDPRQHRDSSVFISRLVIGGAWNLADDYRPVRQNVGVVHLANSFYFRRVQFDYKHSEILGNDPPPVRVCACSPPVYFPTPEPANATPAAPPPGSKDSIQLAWYPQLSGGNWLPKVLRARFTWSLQTIDTPLAQPGTSNIAAHLHGREQSFGLNADTYVHIFGREFFGVVQYARISRNGTANDREQQELVYTSRFPAMTSGRWVFRATLSVGGISDRGGTAINLFNPTFEAFLHEHKTRVNLHVIYSPQVANDGAHGWQTTHQIVLFADRALFVKLFGSRKARAGGGS